MPSSVRYRVVSPILTTTKEQGFITIPPGSIIETSDNVNEPGLYAIRLADEELFAFARDIQERSERIDPPAESEEVVVREPASLPVSGGRAPRQ
jgi:hypothetical protein